MLGHIFPVDFIHCIYIIKKLHAHTSREFILVLIRHGSIARVTTAIERKIFGEGRNFRKCNCMSACLTSIGDDNSFT